MSGKSIEIQTAVNLFFGQSGEPEPSEFGWEVRPSQQRPGEEFYGHEFMVGETRQAASSSLRLAELPGTGQRFGATGEAQLGFASWMRSENGLAWVVVGQRRSMGGARRSQLAGQIPLVQEVDAEFTDAGFFSHRTRLVESVTLARVRPVWDRHDALTPLGATGQVPQGSR